ncbi:MAG: riboflavin biosynthesis protein RibF [Chitinivibrionales bacterium]|nr:riboflavin biosynthesis protein RibF [Chitinivibrionales bacterium]
MELIRSLDSFTCPASVASTGNFDGIHRGHDLLISEVRKRAQSQQVSSIILTFEPHTRAVLEPDTPPMILTTLEEKRALVENKGIDFLVCLSFDSRTRHMSHSDFLQKILIEKLGVRQLVMGKGHTLGKNRMSADSLHQASGTMHFSTFVVSTAASDGHTISSTEIRRKIIRGRLSEAVNLLGHPYLICTKRIRGVQQGRIQGYPTLNFAGAQPPKVTPHTGVYAAKLQFRDTMYSGALYFGNCPTLTYRKEHFEFHSFDAVTDEPSEGEPARLWLYDFIRSDQTFATGRELQKQISKDIITIKEFFMQER